MHSQHWKHSHAAVHHPLRRRLFWAFFWKPLLLLTCITHKSWILKKKSYIYTPISKLNFSWESYLQVFLFLYLFLIAQAICLNCLKRFQTDSWATSDCFNHQESNKWTHLKYSICPHNQWQFIRRMELKGHIIANSANIVAFDML